MALLDADLRLAESVISADETVDLLRHEVEEQAFDVMARQAPVAGDLRLIVTSLRIVSDLERMGDLALHVAQVARRRYPASAVPPELRGTILGNGPGRATHRGEGRVGDLRSGRGNGARTRARRRRHGQPAPPAVHGAARRALVPRHGSCHRHNPAAVATTSGMLTTPSRWLTVLSTWLRGFRYTCTRRAGAVSGGIEAMRTG